LRTAAAEFPALPIVRCSPSFMAAVALALLKKIVTHVSVLDEKDLAWGSGEVFRCRPRSQPGGDYWFRFLPSA
jgi:hypothetical protein